MSFARAADGLWGLSGPLTETSVLVSTSLPCRPSSSLTSILSASTTLQVLSKAPLDPRWPPDPSSRSAIAGPISDKFGRRDAILFACLFWFIGTAIQVACQNWGQLIAGRVMNGITVGITSAQVPVYLAEIAEKDKRGSIVIVQQLAIEFGILIMYFIGYGCSSWTVPPPSGPPGAPVHPGLLRWPSCCRSSRIPAGSSRLDGTTMPWLFSPASRRRGNTEDPLCIAEMEEIRTVLQAEEEAGRGWRKFVKNGMWKRTMAGMTVQVSPPPSLFMANTDPMLMSPISQAWQQLAGANVIVYYLTYIAEMAGLKGDVAMVTSGVQYALFIIFTLVTWAFIDRTGRRTCLLSAPSAWASAISSSAAS